MVSAVLFGQPGAGPGDALQFGEYEVERAPGDEHRGRVHDVLARGPLVDVAGSVFGDLGDVCGQSLDERWDRVTRRSSVAS